MGKSIDWKSYNRNLVNRGQITFWFSPEIIGDWIASPEKKRGAQKFYSDAAIEMLPRQPPPISRKIAAEIAKVDRTLQRQVPQRPFRHCYVRNRGGLFRVGRGKNTNLM